MSVIDEIAAERQRQVDAEGWSAKHDDSHADGSLALAASCYANKAAYQEEYEDLDDTPYEWPWADSWWKPSNPRRDLVKAAALIVAEIERLDRLASWLRPCQSRWSHPK